MGTLIRQRTPTYTRLTPEQQLRIWELHDEHLSQSAIAQRLGCHSSSVSRVLAKARDTRAHALRFLQLRALSFAQRIEAEADVEQSLEVLDRLDVAPRKDRSSGPGQVNIVIGMPGQPAGPAPTIVTLSPGQPQQIEEISTG